MKEEGPTTSRMDGLHRVICRTYAHLQLDCVNYEQNATLAGRRLLKTGVSINGAEVIGQVTFNIRSLSFLIV